MEASNLWSANRGASARRREVWNTKDAQSCCAFQRIPARKSPAPAARAIRLPASPPASGRAVQQHEGECHRNQQAESSTSKSCRFRAQFPRPTRRPAGRLTGRVRGSTSRPPTPQSAQRRGSSANQRERRRAAPVPIPERRSNGRAIEITGQAKDECGRNECAAESAYADAERRLSERGGAEPDQPRGQRRVIEIPDGRGDVRNSSSRSLQEAVPRTQIHQAQHHGIGNEAYRQCPRPCVAAS